MKSALVILFNQDHSINIPKLEEVYRNRFSEILYLVPDHHSATDRLFKGSTWAQRCALPLDRLIARLRRMLGRHNPFELRDTGILTREKSLLRVVGHQFYFYHFLSQARSVLQELSVDWYWVVGDDALLNPRINENSILDFLGVSPKDTFALCRPVLGSDAWIQQIAGSIGRAQDLLSRALPAAPALEGILPEPGALQNRSLPVACADFLGIRRDRLDEFLETCDACFDQKIYVELAVPNIVLSLHGGVHWIEDFDWQRIAADAWRPLVDQLKASPTCAFTHPVKLSHVPTEMLHHLRTATS